MHTFSPELTNRMKAIHEPIKNRNLGPIDLRCKEKSNVPLRPHFCIIN